jgi:branched-chain amino acid transport system substrate-binding protein
MKRSVRILALVLSLVMVFAMLAGCNGGTEATPTPDAGGEDETGPIKMACLAPFSGNYAQYGEGYKASIEMILAEYNANGGYNGREVVCDYYDDKMDPKEAVTVAQKIVNEDYIICVGPWSSTIAFAVASTFGDAKMGLYGISTSHTDVTKQNDYIVRQSPDITQFMTAETRLAYTELGCRKAATLNYVDDMATTAVDLFAKQFESLGGEIVAQETYMTGAVDFTAQLTKIISAGADYICTQGSYSDTARIIQQARELDYTGRIGLAGASYDQGLIDIAGELAEGCAAIVHIDPDQPEAVELAERYSEASGGKVLNAHSYMAYDCAWHVMQALDAVGPDKEAIIAYLRDDKNAEGTFGNVEYTAGNPVAPVFPVVIKDGKFTTLELQNLTLDDLRVPFE